MFCLTSSRNAKKKLSIVLASGIFIFHPGNNCCFFHLDHVFQSHTKRLYFWHQNEPGRCSCRRQSQLQDITVFHIPNLTIQPIPHSKLQRRYFYIPTDHFTTWEPRNRPINTFGLQKHRPFQGPKTVKCSVGSLVDDKCQAIVIKMLEISSYP